MSPSATPATQSAAASRATKAGPSAPPRAMSATPATQNERGCEIVPRLPRKTTVDVRLRHACHVEPKIPKWMSPSATPATQSAAVSRATKRAQARHPVPWVPRLPRKTKVDVRLRHPCHVKPSWMSPSATPATQSAAASRATKRAQARHPVLWVPCLPRKTTVDVRLCHACHVKPRWMSPSATPATQSAAASCATKRAQARHPVPWVPRLPCKTTVDVRLCHACHAKRPWLWDCATPATRNQSECHQVPANAKRPWMWDCATPATWNQSGCHQVPRLLRKVPRRHARPSGPKRATQCHECHACHAKRRWMWDCATPATRNQGGCHQVPRQPRKVARRHAPKRATQCHECHACHAKRPWMWDFATPATWNTGGCHQVPRLPRKVPRRRATKWAQARHPVPWSRRLPCKTTVDVRLCHACHVKSRWMSPSATPATQSAAASSATHACHVKRRWISPSATPATQRWYVTDCMWQSCVWSYVCDRWYVTKLCVKFVCVCEVIVCERWYVTKLCVKFVCVKYGMWQSCMLSLCVWSYCMWEMVCDRRKEAGGGRREAGATRDTELKTRTPHKVVRNQ